MVFKIFIDNGDGLIVKGFQPRFLLEVFAHQFSKDIYNRLHACRWDEALGYKNKVGGNLCVISLLLLKDRMVQENDSNVHCYRVSYTGGVIFHGFAIYQDWKLVLLEPMIVDFLRGEYGSLDCVQPN